MARSTTLKELLKKAIEKEIHSRELYTNLSKKVNDASAKETLLELALQEQGHQQQVQPEVDPGVVGEYVATRPKDQHVDLVADRHQEGGRSCQHHADHRRQRRAATVAHQRHRQVPGRALCRPGVPRRCLRPGDSRLHKGD